MGYVAVRAVFARRQYQRLRERSILIGGGMLPEKSDVANLGEAELDVLFAPLSA